ncbi:MAG: hypothetical protein RLZZ144_328 [Pseudomonadota bacterium]|jgi:RND family efflux transporter MFP subunit
MKCLIFFASLLSLVACSKQPDAPKVVIEPPAMTFIVGAAAGNTQRSYSGEIRARHEATLAFRVGGKLLERAVDSGSMIHAGQVLAKLDSADTSFQLSAADSQWQLADAEVKRYRDLHAKGFVSQAALDAKETTLKSASSQAGLSRNQQNYTTLHADQAGVVVATLADVGQVLGAGQAVLRVALAGEREVSISIPESEFNQLKIGDQAGITLWQGQAEGAKFKGRLRELTPMADASSRTYSARVTLLDKVDVALGMTAEVSFIQSAKKVELLVPSGAIFQQGEQAAVWVVDAQHQVVLRPVKISAYRDQGALIASGLVAGERIVSAGVHKIAAGAKIRAIDTSLPQ